MSKVAENFNEQYGDNTGTQILQFLKSGSFDAPTGDPAQPTKKLKNIK